ncbi:MAG: helix-turn-helix domain-containing protein [Lachnospiraceae bacterium]|nr:helix-turn-helix domain-containing protein [Lachnospiraceae bacterium]
MQKNSFAEILKEKRAEFGYRQCEVAEKLYISNSTYSHYESGTRMPTIENLIKISALYNMNPMELLYVFAPDEVSRNYAYFNFMKHGKYALSTKELRLVSDFNMLQSDEQNAILHMVQLLKRGNCSR